MNKNTRLLLIPVSIFVLILLFSLFSFGSNLDKTARITIEVAPSKATVTLNGKKSKTGEVRVKPGKYTVKATRDGFESDEKTVEVIKGANEYIGLSLASTSSDTVSWYEDNPKDQKLVEKISSINFDQNSEKNNDPILKNLPFVGPGEYYRIDYGSISSSGRVSLIISYTDPEYKNDGLEWIKNRKLDPQDYDITYKYLLESEYLGE